MAANLDVAARVEAIQLRDNLEHGALHFVVAAAVLTAAAAATDCVHLIKEDDAGLQVARSSIFPVSIEHTNRSERNISSWVRCIAGGAQHQFQL